LDVNEEDVETILHLLTYSEIPYTTASEESENQFVDVSTQTDETEIHESEEYTTEKRDFIIKQDLSSEECPFCFCRPCITDDKFRQAWWETEPFKT